MALAARPALKAPASLSKGRHRGWGPALLAGVSAVLMGTSTGAMPPARSAPLPSQAGPAAPSPSADKDALAPTSLTLARAGGTELSASSPSQLALVEILVRKGVVFYGAWWCGHCAHQKSLFGAEAASKLPYVECDKDDPGRLRCQTAKIRAFPTWDYKGERREGVQELEELRVWVGAPRGATNPSSKGSQT